MTVLYRVLPHYDRGEQCGGWVECPLCGAVKVFVSNWAMGQWQTLHESSPGFGLCRVLRESKDLTRVSKCV